MRRLIPLLLAGLLASPAQATTRPLLDTVEGLLPIALPALGSQLQALLGQPVAKGGALRYALNVPHAALAHGDGQWAERDGRAVWQYQLHSPQALSLSASFAAVDVPAGTVLRLADGQGVVWGEARNFGARERFQTAIVPGDTLLLEVELPSSERAADWRIEGVQHGYRSFDFRAKSGSCNIDTVCPAGDAWTAQIRSAARITVAGTALCSAVLMNNTANDGSPLLLTAEHCGVREDNADSVVAYWNYETSRCGGSPDGSLRQSQSGATLLARNPDPDFALLRLDQAPPASYNVHYAGWDASGDSFPSGASVHHPRGDEKRISLFENRPRKVRAIVDGEPVQSWEVVWNQGVTEPGSSGSALFDDAGRVVGQLSGGNSSCDNPQGSDVYGRLDFGWEAGRSASERLAPWLDPRGSGTRRVDGRNGAGNNARTQARGESFLLPPLSREPVPLAVLDNDFGAPPLRLVGASAEQGEALIVDNRLLYTPAPGFAGDSVQYQIIDRHGEASTATAQVAPGTQARALQASELAPRGGAATPGLLLLILLAGLRRRQR